MYTKHLCDICRCRRLVWIDGIYWFHGWLREWLLGHRAIARTQQVGWAYWSICSWWSVFVTSAERLLLGGLPTRFVDGWYYEGDHHYRLESLWKALRCVLWPKTGACASPECSVPLEHILKHNIWWVLFTNPSVCTISRARKRYAFSAISEYRDRYDHALGVLQCNEVIQCKLEPKQKENEEVHTKERAKALNGRPDVLEQLKRPSLCFLQEMELCTWPIFWSVRKSGVSKFSGATKYQHCFIPWTTSVEGVSREDFRWGKKTSILKSWRCIESTISNKKCETAEILNCMHCMTLMLNCNSICLGRSANAHPAALFQFQKSFSQRRAVFFHIFIV